MKGQSPTTSGEPHFVVKDGCITLESITTVRNYWLKLGMTSSVQWLDETMKKAGYGLDTTVVFDGGRKKVET